MSFLTGWSYRKSKTIIGSTTSLTNYQMKFTILKGTGVDSNDKIYIGNDVRDDFGDIRFTKADGITLLDYWIESYSPGVSATLWVEIDSIPFSVSTQIYIYFNNLTATTTSNGVNTFIFFDDFEGFTLDSKWTVGSSIPLVENSVLTLDSGVGGHVYTGLDFNPSIILRAKEKRYGVIGSGNRNTDISFHDTTSRGSYDSPNFVGFYTWYDWNGGHRLISKRGGQLFYVSPLDTIDVDNGLNWHIIELTWDSYFVKLLLDNTELGSVTDPRKIPVDKLRLQFDMYTNVYRVDWVTIRKYASPEPQYGDSGLIESTSKITFFSNPLGASIIINGFDTGIVTPATVNVPSGIVDYELRLACYESIIGSIEIAEGDLIDICRKIPTCTLRKNTGDIDFNSTPVDATIWFDGLRVPDVVTPASFSCVLEGLHTYALTHPNNLYQYYQGEIDLAASSVFNVDAILALLSTTGKGSIGVDSVPRGAMIFLNGTDTGLVTPNTILELIVGTHTIRCELTGYGSVSRSVVVRQNETTSINLDLLSLPDTGSIYFTSTPSLATVTLDGEVLGITPLLKTGVDVGTHHYNISKTGYYDESGTVDVTKDHRSNIDALLEEIPQATGSLSVDSDPRGAAIFLDGSDTGQVTPHLKSGIVVGTHTLMVELEGYEPSETINVIIRDGETTTPDLFTLVPITAEPGSITFSTIPDKVSVELDGVAITQPTPVTVVDVVVGSHTYNLTKTGFNNKPGTIDVAPSQQATVYEILTPNTAGCVYFHSTPPGAHIIIDDVDTGEVTPATICGIPAGEHTYRLVMEGFADVNGNFNVSSQGITIISNIPKVNNNAIVYFSLAALAAGIIYMSSKNKQKQKQIL